jgi:hypothetical protein
MVRGTAAQPVTGQDFVHPAVLFCGPSSKALRKRPCVCWQASCSGLLMPNTHCQARPALPAEAALLLVYRPVTELLLLCLFLQGQWLGAGNQE